MRSCGKSRLSAAVTAICRQPGTATSVSQWSTEIALVVLATMWFSPIVWSYHPTAATPALALVLARTWQNKPLAWVFVVAWFLVLGLFAWRLACCLGAMLWASMALGAVLVWTSRWCSQIALQPGSR